MVEMTDNHYREVVEQPQQENAEQRSREPAVTGPVLTDTAARLAGLAGDESAADNGDRCSLYGSLGTRWSRTVKHNNSSIQGQDDPVLLAHI
jgi:hypothetical protein